MLGNFFVFILFPFAIAQIAATYPRPELFYEAAPKNRKLIRLPDVNPFSPNSA